jgi:hypothetical protein
MDIEYVFENYADGLTLEQSDAVLHELFEVGYFDTYEYDMFEKLYYLNIDEKYIFRYVELHFSNDLDVMLDIVLDNVFYGAHDHTFASIIKKYKLYTEKVIRTCIIHDISDLFVFLFNSNYIKDFCMYHLERHSDLCPRIFSFLFALLPLKSVSCKFVMRNVHTNEFKLYCKYSNFKTFRVSIDNLQMFPGCNITDDSFRSAYYKLTNNNIDHETKIITSTVRILKHRTCDDVFRYMTEFM